jgi:hypothetical protein
LLKNIDDYIFQKTAISENGKSFSFTKKREEKAFLIEFDNLFRFNKRKEKRVDAIFITSDINNVVKIILVELKGIDIKSALEQIESTLSIFSNNSQPHKQFKDKFRTFGMPKVKRAYIIHKNFRALPQYLSNISKIQEKYSVVIKKHENTFSSSNISDI